MLGIVFTGPQRVEVRDDFVVPDIVDGQILVRNKIASICGSDHPCYLGRSKYPCKPGYPGHETIGIVERSRSGRFEEGDAVLALPEGSTGFIEHFAASDERAVPLPHWDDNLVVAQPLGTVIKGARRLDPVGGKTVVVLGQGNIGLLWAQLMRTRGAGRVITIDLLANRLAVSSQVGADDVVDASDEDPVEAVKRLTDGAMGDVVIEAVGEPETQQECIGLAGNGAQVLFFGVPHQSQVALPFSEFYRKVLRLTSSWGADARRDFPQALDLIVSGKVDVAPLVTHRFPVTEFAQAVELAVDGSKGGAIKVLVEFP